jgi:hypothetical protein
MTEHLMARSGTTIVLAPVFAVALVALGIWVAVSPASVPGLTEPGGSSSMEMGS